MDDWKKIIAFTRSWGRVPESVKGSSMAPERIPGGRRKYVLTGIAAEKETRLRE